MAETVKIIEFTDKEVAAKYVATCNIDYEVGKAGLFKNAPLSTINLAMADAMFIGGTNLLELKKANSAPPAKEPVK